MESWTRGAERGHIERTESCFYPLWVLRELEKSRLRLRFLKCVRCTGSDEVIAEVTGAAGRQWAGEQEMRR